MPYYARCLSWLLGLLCHSQRTNVKKENAVYFIIFIVYINILIINLLEAKNVVVLKFFKDCLAFSFLHSAKHRLDTYAKFFINSLCRMLPLILVSYMVMTDRHSL